MFKWIKLRTVNLPPRSHLRRRWLLALLGVVAVVYLPGYAGPLFFDDLHAIVDNPHVRTLWPLSYALSAPEESTLAGRPLPALSFALNYALDELNPRGYHLVNHLLHLLNTLLVFLLLELSLRLTRSQTSLETQPTRSDLHLAGAIALLWAVHPLHTETVHYVVQRTELMMGSAYLLTLYAAARGWVREHQRPHNRWLLLATLACWAGMACKEVMVSAPLLVLAYDRAFISASWRDLLQRHGRWHAALLSSWLLLAGLNVTGPRSETAGFSAGISPWDYLLTQAGVIVAYLRLSLVPWPQSIYHEVKLQTSLLAALPAGLPVLAGFIVTLWALRRRPRCGVLGLAFYAILAPTSSFVPIVTEIMAERRMYLPLLPVLVLLALAARQWLPGRSALAIALLAGVGWTGLNVRRQLDYRDELLLWQQALAANPDNSFAHNGAGFVLLQRNQPAAALEHLLRAKALSPGLPLAWANLGMTYLQQGQLDEALQAGQQALALREAYPKAHNLMGVVLAQQRRYDEAAAHLRRALELQPTFTEASINLARTCNFQRQFHQTRQVVEQALPLAQPSQQVSLLEQLAIAQAALIDQGDSTAPAQLQTTLEQLLRLRPDHPLPARLRQMLAQPSNATTRAPAAPAPR